ncbi:MAG TPA: OB-fold domain-containing protein [Ilumatobacter sp.]|nr:OB-fold domain-containing protein [Ilumatobacter sp.]
MGVTPTIHERSADDPRPVLADDAAQWVVHGFRCTGCGYRLASLRPRCPVCRAALEPAVYGPGGVVWAATVLRAGVPDRETPFGLAYVDLDDGPRVLCHLEHAAVDVPVVAPVPGTRVELSGLTEHDDPQARLA